MEFSDVSFQLLLGNYACEKCMRKSGQRACLPEIKLPGFACYGVLFFHDCNYSELNWQGRIQP